LDFTQPDDVLEAFFQRLHMAEHHGGGSREMQLVRGAHDIEPFATGAFPFADQPANTIAQDLGAGAGK
jgi:hypothetical protein